MPQLIGDGYTKFFKLKERLDQLMSSQHSDCIAKAEGHKDRFNNPEETIPYRHDSTKAENVKM